MDALKMSFKRWTKVLSHIFTILIDSLCQPCDLFEFRLFIMDGISSSLVFNDDGRLSVLMVRGGKVLVFDNGVHCDAKNLLKSSAFFEKFEIISPFTNRGGIEGIFLLLRKRFNIFQYVFGAAWVFVYEVSVCGFDSPCRHLNFRCCACFGLGVSWHSVNCRV